MCIFGSHISLDSSLWVEQLPIHNSDIILNIIKAFKNGGEYKASFGEGQVEFVTTKIDAKEYYSGKVNVKFQESHDVLCISGHTHHQKSSFTDEIRHIVFSEFFSAVKADVLTVDRDKRCVSIKSYGYDGDREYDY